MCILTIPCFLFFYFSKNKEKGKMKVFIYLKKNITVSIMYYCRYKSYAHFIFIAKYKIFTYILYLNINRISHNHQEYTRLT